ncbi:MAG: hypothetical protein M3O32_03400 [Actinomycetota bacterium]|nr:hypothetical protein [Actinomycetota bacterium]
MSTERLAAVLDGSRHITFDPNGFVLAWHGGHTLRVYDLAGTEVDCRCIGDFAQHEATYADIVSAARAYLSEGDLGEDGVSDV